MKTLNNIIQILKKPFVERARRKYKEALRNYSLEEIMLIGKGRKVRRFNPTYRGNFEFDKKVFEETYKIKTKIACDEKSSNRNSALTLNGYVNTNYWLAYARSLKPKNNIDLWLRIGKLKVDYMICCQTIGGDFNSIYIGMPLRRID